MAEQDDFEAFKEQARRQYQAEQEINPPASAPVATPETMTNSAIPEPVEPEVPQEFRDQARFETVFPAVKRLAEKYDPGILDDLGDDPAEWRKYYEGWNRGLDTNTWLLGTQVKDAAMHYDEQDKQDLAQMRAMWRGEPTIFERAANGDVSGALEGLWGNLWRGAVDPINLIPIPGVGVAGKIAANAGIDALATGVMSLGEQHIEKEAGLREDYDLQQAAIEGAVGGLVSGAGQSAARAAGKLLHKGTVERWRGKELADVEKRLAEGVDLGEGKQITPDQVKNMLEGHDSVRAFGVGEEDVVGSINVARQSAMDEVKAMERGIVELHDQFKPSRRTGMDVDKAVHELLEMGAGTPENIGRAVEEGADPNVWKPGTALNAEELGAARVHTLRTARDSIAKIMKAGKSDNPLDWSVAAASLSAFRKQVEYLSGASSEAGRALGQMRRVVDADEIFMSDETASKLLGSMGGLKRMKELSKALSSYDVNNPKALAEVGKLLYNFETKSASDYWLTLYYNGLLSNPSLFVPVVGVNFASNAFNQIVAFPEQMLASGIGFLRGNQDRVRMREIGGRFLGTMHGLVDGLNAGLHVLQNGVPESVTTKLDVGRPTIPGVEGRLLTIPQTGLVAGDEFFKAIARKAEVWQSAYHKALTEGLKGDDFKLRVRQLVDDPTQEMLQKANAAARYYAFQAPLGKVGQAILDIKKHHPIVGAGLAPFISTPVDIMKYAIERSPFAGALGENRAALRGGGTVSDIARARMLLGTTAMAAFTAMAAMGQVTGGAPKDPAELQKWNQENKQPYSIKIGDKWYSMNRLDPIGSWVGFGANLATLINRGLDEEDLSVISAAFSVFTQSFIDKQWATGVIRMVSAIANPEQAEHWASGIAASIVPSGVASYARAEDPILRDVNTVMEALINRVPYMRKKLYPKLDALGYPIKMASPLDTEEGTAADIAVRMLSPGAVKDAEVTNPVMQAINKLDMAKRVAAATISKGPWADVKLTPQQEYIRNYYRGQLAEKVLMPLVTHPNWEMAPVEWRKKQVDKAFRDATSTAHQGLIRMFPDLRARLIRQHNLKSTDLSSEYPSPMVELLEKGSELFGGEDEDGE